MVLGMECISPEIVEILFNTKLHQHQKCMHVTQAM